MSNDVNLWALEEELRRILQRGVDFGGGRVVAVIFDNPDVKWVKLHGNLLEVIYIKGFVKVTIHAAVGNGKTAVMSATLDGMPCGGHG